MRPRTESTGKLQGQGLNNTHSREPWISRVQHTTLYNKEDEKRRGEGQEDGDSHQKSLPASRASPHTPVCESDLMQPAPGEELLLRVRTSVQSEDARSLGSIISSGTTFSSRFPCSHASAKGRRSGPRRVVALFLSFTSYDKRWL